MKATQKNECPHHDCDRSCEFWTQRVGNETDTVIEPVQLQRDKRIEAEKKIRASQARDEKIIKRRIK